MQGIRWSISLVLVTVLCHTALSLPSIRIKRDDEQAFNEQSPDLNPVESEDFANNEDVGREKRKLPEAAFGAKNAVIGFVFSKIDNIIDSKTRILNQLDRVNVEKNRQFNITVPAPINDFQGLITAVVSPKIQGVGSLLSGFTSGILGSLTSLSGSSSGGGGKFGGIAGGGGGANAGLGSFVSQFLRFSGPILQGSSGGGASSTASPGTDEGGY